MTFSLFLMSCGSFAELSAVGKRHYILWFLNTTVPSDCLQFCTLMMPSEKKTKKKHAKLKCGAHDC